MEDGVMEGDWTAVDGERGRGTEPGDKGVLVARDDVNL